MFEILMFLFENYMESSIALKADNATIANELQQVGFDRFEIDRALDWLEGLKDLQQSMNSGPTPSVRSIRFYILVERERIGERGIDFITHLERIGILDPLTREITIDRIMALDYRDIDLGRVKWVALMVLFNQPDKKSALTLLQDMILADSLRMLH